MTNQVTLFSSQNSKKYFFSNQNKRLNLYLCGPTVYGDVHIGNLRGPLFFHLLTKLFNLHNIKFTYYQNITDIDDKIVAKASKLKVSEETIAQRYFDEYKNTLQQLGLDLDLLHFVKVTEHIVPIIDCINQLMQKGFAYQIRDGVYFAVKNLPNYLHLLRKVGTKQHPGEVEGHYCCWEYAKERAKTFLTEQEKSSLKRDCADFALWKIKTAGKTWQSPWGYGRPGWHTECVALINLFFKDTLNVHGGGTDLIYPHHHNEWAQLVALHLPKQLTQPCWAHNGLVHFNQQKISKSQPQTASLWLVKDFLKQHSANVLKLILYSELWSSDLFIDETKMQKYLLLDQQIQNLLRKTQLKLFLQTGKVLSDFNVTDVQLWAKCVDLLSDRLRTYLVIDAVIFTMKDINILLETDDSQDLIQAVKLLNTTLQVFGLLSLNYQLPKFNNQTKNDLLSWQKHLQQKDFLAADRLRTKLQQQGILPQNKWK